MKSTLCFRKSREHISAVVKRKLAKYSNFACSICGAIPIIIHHIEEWSKKFSNAEKFLIPICDKCHRGIHGEGGSLLSKNELYDFKIKPEKPQILLDKLPFERKRAFSFFIGSNFVADGKEAFFFKLPNGHRMWSIDTSRGNFKLTILASIVAGKEKYLIKDNELMIETNNIWNMQYSRGSLKIWKIVNGKRQIFIDLIIKPDVIIIKRMHTSFDGNQFKIFKRKPQRRQLSKIHERVKECEGFYHKIAEEIDRQPRKAKWFEGIDIDKTLKQNQKDNVKREIEQYLSREFCKEFPWKWSDYILVLSEVLRTSSVFGRNNKNTIKLPKEFNRFNDKIDTIKRKYKKEFDEVKGIIAEYNGISFTGNFQA